MRTIPNVIVTCQWLREHLQDKDLVVLNATIPKATVKKESFQKEDLVIPNARFFDIKGVFSDKNADFPNTMISAQKFEEEVQKLGVHQDSCVVIYDEHGIYSAPRAWWMFKTMGFENMAVLDGGLPEWKSLGFDTTLASTAKVERGNFKSNPTRGFVNSQYVLEATKNQEYQMLDARSAGRFYGTAPEPRAGVRSGHIPTSKSLPYSSLLDGNTLKNKEELQTLYHQVNSDQKPMIFSCGTGITACILALGAELSGYENSLVYDGSWTEWGSLLDLPVKV